MVIVVKSCIRLGFGVWGLEFGFLVERALACHSLSIGRQLVQIFWPVVMMNHNWPACALHNSWRLNGCNQLNDGKSNKLKIRRLTIMRKRVVNFENSQIWVVHFNVVTLATHL
jgi:hypothetical protein